MPSGLTFRLFGPLEVTDEPGGPLDLGTRKQRALVAMLALEPGRVVSLDRLIDELWAGEPPARATRTLQAYIAHLRKVLEPGRRPRTPPRVLLTREPGYQLAVAPGQVDLARFTAGVEEGRRALVRGEHAGAREALDQALSLWRGDPLGEFADEEFAQPAVARLTEQRDAAVQNRFEARLALGEAGACVPDLESLVEAHPYRERTWGLLVLALYRTGRQADALAALRRIRTRLSDELGIEPGPELRRLERAVFEQAEELELRGPGPGPASAPASATSVAADPVRPPEPTAGNGLVAREAELRRVQDRLAGLRRGHSGVMLITGEAGIGKTRLVQTAADEAAARGFRVAWGRCVDGRAPAFWPWIQVLRECGNDAGPLSGEIGPPSQDPDAALYERYERVVAALTAQGGPLVVVLDDLHWADASSLQLLTFVGGALARGASARGASAGGASAGDPARHSPVLVIATLRPEPGDHPRHLRDTLGALSREQATERMELAAFTADDVSSYLRSRQIPEGPELVGLLLERTGGNPFYLGELLRLRESEHGLSDVVPPGARDVIDRRVARLPEETRELLHAAAVAGRDVEIDVMEAVTGAPAEQVMSLLEPAVATGLLTEPPSGSDYRFSHTLVRDALYSGLSRLARARLHLRVGEALEPRLPEAESATLAYHFALAAKVGGAAKAVEHASRAGRYATAQLAYAEAAESWELALASLPPADAARPALLTRLGESRRTVGDAEGARRDIDEAIELARRSGDRETLIAAITVFGGLAVWIWRPYGEVDQAMVGVLEDLLAGPLRDRDRAALLGTLGMELYYGPRHAEAEQATARAVTLAREVGDTPLLARTLNNHLLTTWLPGRNLERQRAAEEMLALPRLPRAAELVARIMRMACLLRACDLAEWNRDLIRCQHLLDEVRRPELEAMVRIAETARCTLDGRWDDAESLLDRFGGLRFGSSLWGQRFRNMVTTFTCRRGQGRVAEILDELVAAAEEPFLAPLQPIAILAAVEAGRPELARDLMGRWGTEIREDWIADFLIPVWGLIAARLGVPDPRELYDRLAPHADQLVIAGMGSAGWGSTHLILAELAQRLDRTDQAHEHARAALDTHRRLGLAYLEERSARLVKDLG